MNYQEGISFESTEIIASMQLKRLNLLLQYSRENSPYYSELFLKHHIGTDPFSSLEELQKIPTTNKDDMQSRNWDFLCIPKQNIAEYTSTSGTSGKRVIIALSRNDLERLAVNECMAFEAAGLGSQDLFQLMLTLDRMFMAGIAYYQGIHKLGAGVVRVGPGLPALHVDKMLRVEPTVLIAVPSFILKVIEHAHSRGIAMNDLSVKKIICIGENIRDQNFELNVMGLRIREDWDVELISTYAATEMQTAFCECTHGNGGHLNPELLIAEVLDQDGKPVERGVAGELVVTTLGVEAMPLIRFCTGDMAVMHNEPCSCGRKSPRISPVIGRKQQMIKLKGTTLFPQGIFDLIQTLDKVEDYTIEVSTNELLNDDLTIHICAMQANQSDVEKEIKEAFQSRLRVVPSISFVTRSEMDKLQFILSGRKINRFLDNRKLGISGI